jgi:ABC-type transport system involved in cytochrome bd biosynthesis fused ATPase/permease subunit
MKRRTKLILQYAKLHKWIFLMLFICIIVTTVSGAIYRATDDELHTVCEKANILDFILSQPDGFDTIIAERGIKPSGVKNKDYQSLVLYYKIRI